MKSFQISQVKSNLNTQMSVGGTAQIQACRTALLPLADGSVGAPPPGLTPPHRFT